MEGYKNKNRWVDLSGLPRHLSGSWAGHINWKKSVGYSVPFQYDRVNGYIKIADYEIKNNTYIWLTIDDYVPEPRKFCTAHIIKCEIDCLVGHRIVDYAPELIKYLKDVRDAFKYTPCSNQYVPMVCPTCGHCRLMKIQRVFLNGFSCPICSDGVSYPNKFISNILKQLKIDFIREVTKKNVGFEWAQNYRYDFAFNIANNKIIIEADGGFHRYEYQQAIDDKKNKLAQQNGYTIYRIDCDYGNNSRYEYIKNSLINSELSKILSFNSIDWTDCNQKSSNNLLYETCQLWEQEKRSVGIIKNILNISAPAVYKYLKRGYEMGLCPSYNRQVSKKRKTGLPLAYIRNNHIVYVFQKTTEVIEQSMGLFGVQCTTDGVNGVCAGRHKTHRGLSFKRITYAEYEQYKLIENNNKIKVVGGDSI